MGNIPLGNSTEVRRSPRRSPRPPMPLPTNAESTKARAYRFDVFIVGDFGCGKTSLALHFLREQIREPLLLQPQRYRSRELDLGNLGKAQLKFLDTLGQERYSTIPIATYQKADIILVAFDLTNRESFSNLKAWYSEAKLHSYGKAVIALVGCKSDLSSERQVKHNEVLLEFSSRDEIIYIETSSVTGDNVQLLMERVVSKLIRCIQEDLISYDETTSVDSCEFKASVSPINSPPNEHSIPLEAGEDSHRPKNCQDIPTRTFSGQFRASVTSSRRVVLTNSPYLPPASRTPNSSPQVKTKNTMKLSMSPGVGSKSHGEDVDDELDL